MLSPDNRLRHRRDFSEVVRRGRRASRPLLTVHLRRLASGSPRAGLVVSKQVGGSVVRSTVSRRLRHQLREVLPALPDGTQLVVRASAAAAVASSAELGSDLRAALRKLDAVTG
ncbi:MAG: ribonuclease P protein component [Mycobacteriales bacterium]